MKEIGYVNASQTIHKGVLRNLRAARQLPRLPQSGPAWSSSVSEPHRWTAVATIALVLFCALLLFSPLLAKVIK